MSQVTTLLKEKKRNERMKEEKKRVVVSNYGKGVKDKPEKDNKSSIHSSRNQPFVHLGFIHPWTSSRQPLSPFFPPPPPASGPLLLLHHLALPRSCSCPAAWILHRSPDLSVAPLASVTSPRALQNLFRLLWWRIAHARVV